MSLTDVLGISIAFITLILLISILVTALVQTVQGLLRLRARNLLKGLAALLINTRFPTDDRPPAKQDITDAKLDAMKLMNTRILTPGRIRPRKDAESSNKRPGLGSFLEYYLVGPRISWIEPEDLPAALREAKTLLKNGSAEDATADELHQFQINFDRLQPQNTKRFQMVSRVWSFVFAVLVAAALQISTPELLQRLSTDSAYRERILANSDADRAYAQQAIARVDYEHVAQAALDELAGQFPDSRAKIEQASGTGVNKASIVDELRVALEGDSRRDEIVASYQKKLDAASADATDVAGDTLGRLAAYDISVWPRGLAFFYGRDEIAYSNIPDTEPRTNPREGKAGAAQIRWRNILGVMITAILLSLGAPFWFKALKDIAGLRDTLAGKNTPPPPNTPPAPAPNSPEATERT